MQTSRVARAAQSRKSKDWSYSNSAFFSLSKTRRPPQRSLTSASKKKKKKNLTHSLRAPLLAAQLRRRHLLLFLRQSRPNDLEGRGEVPLVGVEGLALGGRGGGGAGGEADRHRVGRADLGRQGQRGISGASRADPGGEEEGVEAGRRGGGGSTAWPL